MIVDSSQPTRRGLKRIGAGNSPRRTMRSIVAMLRLIRAAVTRLLQTTSSVRDGTSWKDDICLASRVVSELGDPRGIVRYRGLRVRT
jgi:hypothetical protein